MHIPEAINDTETGGVSQRTFLPYLQRLTRSCFALNALPPLWSETIMFVHHCDV
jgi:hypothetical protein